jgi:hypothetical protein
MDVAAVLPVAIAQIKFVREYTLGLLADISDDQWLKVPAGLTTHVGWQVGHVAMAEYGLCLYRVRGRKSEDLELMPSKFRKQFSRGSTPDLDPANNPSPTEMKDIFSRIHEQVLTELATFTVDQLSQPADMPFMASPTAMGAVLFSSHHEMIHAGQIGLIRRLLGKPPLR